MLVTGSRRPHGIHAARGGERRPEERTMSDQKPEAVKQASLTDEEIVTERKLPRRAFLSTTGVLLAGGAAAVVAGARGLARDFTPQGDPDKAKSSDPDKKKASDPDKKKASHSAKKKASDPDKKKQKASDPDSHR